MDRPPSNTKTFPNPKDEIKNPFMKVFNSYEYDGWNTFWGKIFQFNIEIVVVLFYLPLFIILPNEQASELYFGALESVKQGSEIAGLVIAAPVALAFASLTIPFDILVGGVYVAGVAIETSYYWVEHLITGDDMNELVNQNI